MAGFYTAAFNRALYGDSNDYSPSYEQQEYRCSYVIGTDHQYEHAGRDLSTVKQLHVNDSDEIRREFNRRFNAIIAKHTEIWHNDNTPAPERNRAYYAHRYRLYFYDIMRLLEEFPDAGSNAFYWSVVHSWERYRELCAYYAGMSAADYWSLYDFKRENDNAYHWHFWTNLPFKRPD